MTAEAREGDEPLMTAAAAAALLGLSPRTVYALAASGALPHDRLGAAVRFSASDLRAFKAACRVEAREPTGAAEASPSPAPRPTLAPARRSGAGHELLAMFRRAGVEPKLTPGAGRRATKR